MHVAHLRRELDDRLFVRTSSGLGFTPGGLRLASRAVEILGLQDRTVREVSQAGNGRRLLRMAASRLFAEHAAPGLIELFAGRADDLDVELSVQRTAQFAALLTDRTVDVAIGPPPTSTPATVTHKPFLNHEVLAVVAPGHPLAGHTIGPGHARTQTWLLGPSGTEDEGVAVGMLHLLGVPERNQRIFQSDAAALEETKRTNGIALALRFAVASDLAAGRLAQVEGPGMRANGRPFARMPGPSTWASRPAARSEATANRSARAIPFVRLVSSSAAASLWKIRWLRSGTPRRWSMPTATPSSSVPDGPSSQVWV